jgi:osmotically inducible protein OsmC
MAAERRANAVWEGNLTEGKGTITSVGSGAIGNLPVTWAARTEQPGGKTSPEELIAAAHASCFCMEFANLLNEAGKPPERLTVSATCRADVRGGAFTILAMDLEVSGRVPNIDRAEFERVANAAKTSCPVSRALANNIEIRLKAAHLED